MKVTFENVGKRYASAHWVFKGFNDTIDTGGRVAITGGNGSGKSTLLQIVGGIISPSAGQVSYLLNDQALEKEAALSRINFVAPYLELIEEFSVMELLQFHFKFKQLIGLKTLQELIKKLYLEGNENKWVKNLSSGMKQRLKLGLAFYAQADLILLDEPTTNLDEKGIAWYQAHVSAIPHGTTLLIASNQKQEYQCCDKIISVQQEFSK